MRDKRLSICAKMLMCLISFAPWEISPGNGRCIYQTTERVINLPSDHFLSRALAFQKRIINSLLSRQQRRNSA